VSYETINNVSKARNTRYCGTTRKSVVTDQYERLVRLSSKVEKMNTIDVNRKKLLCLPDYHSLVVVEIRQCLSMTNVTKCAAQLPSDTRIHCSDDDHR
jgi:hypothetical protein